MKRLLVLTLALLPITIGGELPPMIFNRLIAFSFNKFLSQARRQILKILYRITNQFIYSFITLT